MVHQSCSYLKLKGSTYYFSRRVPKNLQKHSRLIVLKSVCVLISSLQLYVRLRCWQSNWKIIGISSEDERLNTGSLGALVTAVITRDRLLV